LVNNSVYTKGVPVPKNKEFMTKAPDGTPIGRTDGDDDYYLTNSPKNFKMFK
jgi:hypothetical protein